MKISYDKEADAAYIEFQKGEFAKNKKVDDFTIIDLDKDGNTRGNSKNAKTSRKIILFCGHENLVRFSLESLAISSTLKSFAFACFRRVRKSSRFSRILGIELLDVSKSEKFG